MRNLHEILGLEHAGILGEGQVVASIDSPYSGLFDDLASVGECLNSGVYNSLEGYQELTDIYKSVEGALDDTSKEILQRWIFGYAKDSGIDFGDAAEIWSATS